MTFLIKLPNLMGISGVNNKQPAYLVLGKTLKSLPHTRIEAILGAFGLLYLYGLKYGMRFLSKRYPNKKRFFFFIGILRNISLIIICTLFAFLINLGKNQNNSPISILKTVPAGF